MLLSVAFVAGSLIFSDTVSRTFDRLFASTAADVTVSPRENLDEALPSGFTPTLPGAHGTSAAGDGLLSDGAGNALNVADLDINFLGSDETRAYNALLEIIGIDDNGDAQSFSFQLLASTMPVPEPSTIAFWLVGGLAMGACIWRTRQRRAVR